MVMTTAHDGRTEAATSSTVILALVARIHGRGRAPGGAMDPRVKHEDDGQVGGAAGGTTAEAVRFVKSSRIGSASPLVTLGLRAEGPGASDGTVALDPRVEHEDDGQVGGGPASPSSP